MGKMKLWGFLGIMLVIGWLVGCGTFTSKGSDKPQINNAQLKVNDLSPDFRLPDHKGGYVRLSDYRGKSNVIIAFYPAAFTPV